MQLGEPNHPGLLEIKLLRLHVGSWVKVKGPALGGVGDQPGVFIDLKEDRECVRSQRRTFRLKNTTHPNSPGDIERKPDLKERLNQGSESLRFKKDRFVLKHRDLF